MLKFRRLHQIFTLPKSIGGGLFSEKPTYQINPYICWAYCRDIYINVEVENTCTCDYGGVEQRRVNRQTIVQMEEADFDKPPGNSG